MELEKGLKIAQLSSFFFLLVIVIENTLKDAFWLASQNSLNFSLAFSKLHRLRQFIIASGNLKYIK